MHDHDYDEAGRCERHVMELEADLADERRQYRDMVKEHDAKWRHYYEGQKRLSERLDQLHDRNHAEHMTRLDRIGAALERIAEALGGKAST